MAKSKQDKISINSAPKKEIVYRTTSVLIPYARNSRTHSPQQTQQIASSIKEFGFTNPVLIDEENGIIAGHGRVLAAQLLGMDEVPCIVLSGMTEAKKRAYVIADNKLALNAGWDDEMLRLEFEDLKAMDFDLDLAGFSSTLIAAEKTARKCFMMELDPKFCDVIIKRWQDFTGKQAVHAETGEAFNGNGTTA